MDCYHPEHIRKDITWASIIKSLLHPQEDFLKSKSLNETKVPMTVTLMLLFMSPEVCAASSEEGGLTNLTRSNVDPQTERLVTQQRSKWSEAAL